MSKYALFDLDHTLLLGDSDYAWGEYLSDKNIVDPIIFRKKNRDYYQDYVNGTLNVEEYYRFALEPLVINPISQMEALRAEFLQEIIAPMISNQARELVQEHQNAGDVCIIITATQSFVTAPIASLFGVSHLIATEPEIVNGLYTGLVSGAPCIREGKITKFHAWLESQSQSRDSIEHITAYSDSFNDLPLLQMADTAVAVNPDERLMAHAEAQAWRILKFM